MKISMCAREITVGHQVGKVCQCFGIDISAGTVTPSSESDGVYLCLDGPDALVMEAFDVLVRSGFPFAKQGTP